MALHGNRGIYDSINYAETMEKLRTHYTAQEIAQDKQKQEQSQKLTKQERKAQTAGRKAETAQKRKTRGTAQERKEYERRKESEVTQREAMTEYLPMAEDAERAAYNTGKTAQKRRPKKHYIVTGTDSGTLTDLAGVIIDRRAEHIARQALKTAYTHSGQDTMRKLWQDSFYNNSAVTDDYNGMIDADHAEHTTQERKTHTRKRINIGGKVIMQECLPYDTLELTEYGRDTLTAQEHTATDFDDLKQTAALAYIEHATEVLHIDDIERQDGHAFAAVNAAIYNAKKNRINTDESIADTMTVGTGTEANADYTERVIYGKTRTAQTMEALFDTADTIAVLEQYITEHAKSNMNVQALLDSFNAMATGETVTEQAERTGKDKKQVRRSREYVVEMCHNAEVRALLTEAMQV